MADGSDGFKYPWGVSESEEGGKVAERFGEVGRRPDVLLTKTTNRAVTRTESATFR